MIWWTRRLDKCYALSVYVYDLTLYKELFYYSILIIPHPRLGTLAKCRVNIEDLQPRFLLYERQQK